MKSWLKERLSSIKAGAERRAMITYVAATSMMVSVAGSAYAVELDMGSVDSATGLGPLKTAVKQFADMNTGAKALIIIVGFLVALISLAALKNFGPVLGYIGLAIFAAVGLTVAFAIAGSVI